MIYTIRLHEVSPFLTYLGKASTGSLESDLVWQLQKIETIDGTMSITYPSGDHSFSYNWTDHSSYTYQ